MKKIILSMAVSLFICACTAKTELKTTRRTPIDSLVGNWIYYQYNGKQSDTNQTFHLVLKKQNKILLLATTVVHGTVEIE